MKQKNLYIVSNWESYCVAEALDHHSALEKIYPNTYKLIPSSDLTEDTVTHAMVCQYTLSSMKKFNCCGDGAGILLLMNELPETLHFQLTNDFHA